MKTAFLAVLSVIAVLSAISPCRAQNGSGFSVAPASLEVSVPEDGTANFYVYVTSHFEGKLVVGTEGIPFEVEPQNISVNVGESNKKVKLTLHTDAAVDEGKYFGKLTFLAHTGKNVAYGIKLNILVTQSGSRGVVAGLIDQLGGRNAGGGNMRYAIIIVSGLFVIAALLIGLIIVRRLRR